MLSNNNLSLFHEYETKLLDWANLSITQQEKNVRISVGYRILTCLKTKMCELDLSNLNLNCLPPVLSRLKIEILDLSNNNLQELPEELLPSLKSLKISNNPFKSDIPSKLFEISDLNFSPKVPLKKRRSTIQALVGPWVNTPTGEYRSTPSGNHNISIWGINGNPSRVEAANRIVEFKLERRFFQLNLSGLGLNSLPPDFDKIKNIQVLDLSNNKFSRLPKSLKKLLPTLKLLKISNNPLTSIDERLFNISDLNLARPSLEVPAEAPPEASPEVPFDAPPEAPKISKEILEEIKRSHTNFVEAINARSTFSLKLLSPTCIAELHEDVAGTCDENEFLTLNKEIRISAFELTSVYDQARRMLLSRALQELPRKMENLGPKSQIEVLIEASPKLSSEVPPEASFEELPKAPLKSRGIPINIIGMIQSAHANFMIATYDWTYFCCRDLSNTCITELYEDVKDTPREQEFLEHNSKIEKCTQEIKMLYAQARGALQGLHLDEEKDETS